MDVIKIDTEGAELTVLRGGGIAGQEDAPLIVYEAGFLSKGFGYHPVESMWFLKRNGVPDVCNGLGNRKNRGTGASARV